MKQIIKDYFRCATVRSDNLFLYLNDLLSYDELTQDERLEVAKLKKIDLDRKNKKK